MSATFAAIGALVNAFGLSWNLAMHDYAWLPINVVGLLLRVFAFMREA